MLPLEAERVVGGTKDSSVEGINELYDKFIAEPVSDGRVLLDCFVAGRAGVSIVRTDEAWKFWPLEVCCTHGE